MWRLQMDTVGRYPVRGFYQRKENRIQEGGKGKRNQVGSRIKCSLRNPLQGTSSLLVGMGVFFGPLLWKWPEGYLDQEQYGVHPWIKEAPKRWMRKNSQEKDFQRLHYGRINNCSDVLLLCAQSNRGYLPGV